MKLLILYGNADLNKRKELARKIMIQNPQIIVQYPEICLPKVKSYEEEEKSLMQLCSMNLIFLESEASSYELAMMKELKLSYKILYSDFSSKNNKNYLLKNSGFIHDFIRKDEIPNGKIINIKPLRLDIIKRNNLLTEIYLKYDVNKLLTKIGKDINNLQPIDNLKEQKLKEGFEIIYIRKKYIELVNLLKEITLKNNIKNFGEFNKLINNSLDEMCLKNKNNTSKEISVAIWNKWKLRIVKLFLSIEEDRRIADKILVDEEYENKEGILKKFKELNKLISEYNIKGKR